MKTIWKILAFICGVIFGAFIAACVQAFKILFGNVFYNIGTFAVVSEGQEKFTAKDFYRKSRKERRNEISKWVTVYSHIADQGIKWLNS